VTQAPVYFINRFYHPDISATSQMLTDLATGLADQYNITVVTSRELYNDPLARLSRKDKHLGVDIQRLNTTRLGRARLWRRAFDYLTFYLAVMWWLARNIKPGDVVVLMTDPPLLQLINTSIIRINGGRVINWLQDIFPEIAQRLGAFPGPDWLASLLARWRDRALRAAQVNVVISGRMKKYLANRGIDNTEVIPNWSDGELITPLAHADNPLREAWGVSDKFTVAYSGNFGRVHGFAAIIQAMSLLSSHPEIHFLLIGEGAALQSLRADIERAGLTNVSFRPYQARESLRYSLGLADLHLVSLKAGMEDLVLPSKVYGALAAGRPVAFIGDPAGNMAKMLQAEGIGFAVAPENGAELAERILSLAKAPERLLTWQKNARALFEREFSRSDNTGCWRRLLQSQAGS